MGVSKKLETAMGMGLATTFVMTLASICAWLIDTWILIPLNLIYLRTLGPAIHTENLYHCDRLCRTVDGGPGDVTITQNPDSEIWRDSILHSAMHSLMNSQDRDTRDRSLNDDNVLEISEPRI